MAPTTLDEKVLKSGQLTVSTHQILPTSDLSSPASTNARRNSSMSTPCSTHVTNGFDTDIEAMVPVTSAERLNKTATPGGNRPDPDCPVWPGRDHWKQKARTAKINNRSCQCMARLSKRNRVIIKVLIALLIVGIAVGVGLGVSKSLGTGIWHPKDR
ncbi:hypothetical protein F4779DRAFT_163782 [Xylariaceae sp. FL0662B]|nr:hypothetical protein F4779DRAFT_163782 [Xylariaceae sp. FL0662B]